MMQVSHIEVRRHPIWQRELRQTRRVESAASVSAARGRVRVAMAITLAATAAFATLVVRMATSP